MSKVKKIFIIFSLFLILLVLVWFAFIIWSQQNSAENYPPLVGSVIEIGEQIASPKSRAVGFDHYVKGNSAYLYSASHDGLNYRSCSIEKVDSKTFIAINPIYTKDKDRVFAVCKEIIGADPETFELISGYAKDKNYAYIYENRIEGSDGKTFEVLSNGFNKDKNNFYLGAKRIDVDYLTFTIGQCYSKDKNNVYYNSNFNSQVQVNPIIKVADVKSFKELGDCYANDAYNVFFIGRVIEGADTNSFEIANTDKTYIHRTYDAVDNNFKYKSGKRID
ncbi:MAG: DKNYY domain-containing protein [Patescibacteria group bacterium]|jgi:hypothetical protein